jgi:bifunctional polynucleotide phosphatase/kinase
MKRVKLNKIVPTSSLNTPNSESLNIQETISNISVSSSNDSKNIEKSAMKKKSIKKNTLFSKLPCEKNQHLIYPNCSTMDTLNSNFLDKKLAMFDFDGTIVKPKDGRRFPKNREDWKFLFPQVPLIFLQYHIKGYQIVLITDQTHDWKVEMILDVLEEIDKIYKEKYIELSKTNPLYIHILIHREKNSKKPNFTFFENEIGPFKKEVSIYIGDACGREGDWSNVDLEFSKNIGVTCLTPENIWFDSILLNDESIKKELSSLILIPSVNPIEEDYKVDNVFFPIFEKEMIIMVGLPGSGKSTFIEMNILNDYGEMYERVSGDELKTESKMLKKTKEILTLSKNPIIDATNISKKKREVFIHLGKEKGINIRCIILKKNLETVLEQNQKRNAQIDLLLKEENNRENKKKVPNVAIYTCNKKMEEPSLEEGFNDILIIE